MHYTRFVLFVLAMIGSQACHEDENKIIYSSDQLVVYKITDRTYVHKTYLQTESYGKVGCNGLIYVNDKEAIVFDTPADTTGTIELIKVVSDYLNAKITTIVPTHFHGDCLGGLAAAHDRAIPSIANQLTIELAKEAGETVPLIGFDNRQTLNIGEEEAVLWHAGEGHTIDNIIGYIPAEQVIFGGCLVKTLEASKGYTGDANLEAWSNTIAKIKFEFPEAKVIVPGHGSWGGQELLDYTIQLFSQ